MSVKKVDVLLLPVTAQTVSPEEIAALETKRIRRLRELGDWRPSSGFHIEPTLPPEIPAQPQPMLRPFAELSVLEGRDIPQPEQSTEHPATPRRIRARRATRAAGDVTWLALSGSRQSLYRG